MLHKHVSIIVLDLIVVIIAYFVFYSTAASAEDRKLIEKHIKEQGCLILSSYKVLLCGLPRTGKTTAMLRLSNQLRYLNRNEPQVPSTGFEKPQTVELYHRTGKQSVMITSVGKWEKQDLEQQGQTLYSRILKSFSENAPSPAKSSFSSRSRSSGNSGAEELSVHISKGEDGLASNSGTEKQKDDVLPINRGSEDQSLPNSKNEDVVAGNRGAEELSLLHSKDVEVLPSPSTTVDEQSVLTSLVKAHEWSKVREKIKAIEDVTILHMMDCGGHPECHEILPLLLEGRALSLIFFRQTPCQS